MISVKLKKSFPDLIIDVTESFHEGINVLAGRSGSGKSTLIKMIAGFLQPDSGFVRMSNALIFSKKNHINLKPEKRRIGYVPQNYLLFPHLNVFENVAFGLRQEKQAEQKLIVRVKGVLELCNIINLSKRYPHQLSGGEKQRVAIARAIAIKPNLLILDEPFAALDVQTRQRIRTEMIDILQEASIPAIIVTHDPLDAHSFGKQVFIMEEGKIIQKGLFEQLKQHPQSRFVEEFTRFSGLESDIDVIKGNIKMMT